VRFELILHGSSRTEDGAQQYQLSSTTFQMINSIIVSQYQSVDHKRLLVLNWKKGFHVLYISRSGSSPMLIWIPRLFASVWFGKAHLVSMWTCNMFAFFTLQSCSLCIGCDSLVGEGKLMNMTTLSEARAVQRQILYLNFHGGRVAIATHGKASLRKL
jgi:hypothetical protein